MMRREHGLSSETDDSLSVTTLSTDVSTPDSRNPGDFSYGSLRARGGKDIPPLFSFSLISGHPSTPPSRAPSLLSCLPPRPPLPLPLPLPLTLTCHTLSFMPLIHHGSAIAMLAFIMLSLALPPSDSPSSGTTCNSSKPPSSMSRIFYAQ